MSERSLRPCDTSALWRRVRIVRRAAHFPAVWRKIVLRILTTFHDGGFYTRSAARSIRLSNRPLRRRLCITISPRGSSRNPDFRISTNFSWPSCSDIKADQSAFRGNAISLISIAVLMAFDPSMLDSITFSVISNQSKHRGPYSDLHNVLVRSIHLSGLDSAAVILKIN